MQKAEHLLNGNYFYGLRVFKVRKMTLLPGLYSTFNNFCFHQAGDAVLNKAAATGNKFLL